MKEKLLKQYKNISLVLGYIAMAILVYGYWMHIAFQTWYITLITIVVIITLGSVIGCLFIRNELRKEENNIENKQ